jgi:hypothetical protein
MYTPTEYSEAWQAHVRTTVGNDLPPHRQAITQRECHDRRHALLYASHIKGSATVRAVSPRGTLLVEISHGFIVDVQNPDTDMIPLLKRGSKYDLDGYTCGYDPTNSYEPVIKFSQTVDKGLFDKVFDALFL